MISVWGKGNASKALAKALGVRRNRKNADVIIRYGVPVRENLQTDPRGRKVINKIDAIRRASNKYKTLVILKEAGVRVPKFSRDYRDLDGCKLIFGRSDYHSKGTDIIVHNTEEWGADTMVHSSDYNSDYYIEYLKSKAEYRYHVAFGKVILPTKKVLAEGETDDTLIRNHQDGKWRQVTCVETPRFSEACIKAVASLGLDFGAVDFLNVDKEAVILEVNTAAGLEVDNRLEAYKNAIISVV